MTTREAKGILKEMAAWHRKEGPYSDSNPDTARCIPYTTEEFCTAIDIAVEMLDKISTTYYEREEQHPETR